MILKEHHKEFAVKAFAQFMPCKQVVSTFIQEFPNDIPKPPKPTQLQLPDASKEEYEEEKEQFVDSYLQKDVYPQYKDEYGENADEQWEKDINELKAEVEKEYERVCPQDNEELQQLQNAGIRNAAQRPPQAAQNRPQKPITQI